MIARVPLQPRLMCSQKRSRPTPNGDTTPMPEMTMQHCTDETTDKKMTTQLSPMAKENCTKNDTQKTATGYVTDSVCSFGGTTMTSHSEVTGDFNSAYSVKVTSHNEGAPAGAPRDTDMTPQLTNIKAKAGVQAVLNPGFGQGPAIVTRNFKQLGFSVPLYQSHGVASKGFIDAAGDAAGAAVAHESARVERRAQKARVVQGV